MAEPGPLPTSAFVRLRTPGRDVALYADPVLGGLTLAIEFPEGSNPRRVVALLEPEQAAILAIGVRDWLGSGSW